MKQPPLEDLSLRFFSTQSIFSVRDRLARVLDGTFVGDSIVLPDNFDEVPEQCPSIGPARIKILGMSLHPISRLCWMFNDLVKAQTVSG